MYINWDNGCDVIDLKIAFTKKIQSDLFNMNSICKFKEEFDII